MNWIFALDADIALNNAIFLRLLVGETDAPRGKLILIYGLIHGETKPSEYIANKMFECFYCKRCDNSCSAGVSITDIFTDARADFADAGFWCWWYYFKDKRWFVQPLWNLCLSM